MNDGAASSELMTAVVAQLIRKGLLDADDITAIADELSRQADAAGSVEEREMLESSAHLANCLLIEAHAPSQSEWEAEQARSQFRVVGGVQHKPVPEKDD